MDVLLLMILNALVQIHPIEARAERIKHILEMANDGRDIIFFGSIYDSGSVLSIEEELTRYLYSLEHPECYRSPDDDDIDLEAYEKMFGGDK